MKILTRIFLSLLSGRVRYFHRDPDGTVDWLDARIGTAAIVRPERVGP